MKGENIVKIFIAGAKSINSLDAFVQKKLMSICQKNYDVVVGDCYGVDSLVQKFYANVGYRNIEIFASNGKARNNVGNWTVHNVPVPASVRGFEFYKQKDIAMANTADYGFMIWDGESKGTLNNMINLISRNKPVMVYLINQKKVLTVENTEDLNELLRNCNKETKSLYLKLRGKENLQISMPV